MKGFGFYIIITIVMYLRIIFCSEKPVITLESDGELRKAKQKLDESFGGLVIKGPGNEMIVECFSSEHALSRKLSEKFKKVRDDMPKFTCFYDYYDVLTIIDESIAFTFELINTVTDNFNKNKKTYEENKSKIEKILENFNKLAEDVKKYSAEKDSKLPDNLKDVNKVVSELETSVAYLRENDLKYYNDFKIENYYDVNKRVSEIKSFRGELENLKKEICPLGEQDKNGSIKEDDLIKNPDLFKKLRKYAFEIYDHLSKCQALESKKLKFLFTFFNGILSEVEDFNKKLEGYKEKLGKPGV
jgi:chromosome segregation ATPase